MPLLTNFSIVKKKNISIILLLSMAMLPSFFHLKELLYIDVKYIIYLKGFLHVTQPQKSKWNKNDSSIDMDPTASV